MRLIVSIVGIFFCTSFLSQEICDNGIDDDSDGMIDLQDSECACSSSSGSSSVSLIANHSFENYSTCPTTHSQLTYADQWQQASTGTSDFLHTCGATNNALVADPAMPIPDGNGYAGFFNGNNSSGTYKEYIGQCLTTPLLADSTYNLQISILAATGNSNLTGLSNTNPEIVLYGTSDCSNLPFSGVDCPTTTPGWNIIHSQTISISGSAWTTVNFTFTPTFDVTGFVIGGSCAAVTGGGMQHTSGYYSNYYYIDNLILTDSVPPSQIPVILTPTGDFCSNNILLNANSDTTGGSWQWYLNDVALVGETASLLDVSGNNYGTGNFTIRYFKNGNCAIDSYVVTSNCGEICDNGIDDDGNGLIDLNDTACECTGFATSQVNNSLVPNYDFEIADCCPSNYSQLNCANTWVQASQNTSDYFNTCDFDDPFSVNPYPLPDGGNGYGGFIDGSGGFQSSYKEYIGACLTSPLMPGTSYTFQISIAHADGDPNLDFVLYGTPNCGDLPFNGTCPTGNGSWNALSNVLLNFTTKGTWQQVTFTFTPSQPINAIILGGNCNPHPVVSSTSGFNYYYIDELVLAETSGFGSVTITESGGICSNNLSLNATADTTGTWQWYLDGIALVGETAPTLDVSINNYGLGTYTVKLTNGLKCETAEYIVSPPLKPNAAFYATNVCQGEPVSFIDTSNDSTATIIGWQWDFNNDGVIDNTTQNPSFTYPIAGTFTATLIATSSNGCNDTITSDPSYNPADSVDVLTSAPLIIVSPKPTANFTFDTVCVGNPTNFYDSSYGANISSWEWTIDGTTDNNQNPFYTYSSSGPHTVQLKVISDSGCTDSITKNVLLESAPIASFNYTGNCENDVFQFSNQTTINGASPNPSSISYAWNFGDMTTSSIENPTKSYSNGSYTVQFSVITPAGCFDDTIVPLTVFPTPVADFTNTEVCFGEPTTLTNQSTAPNGGNITSYEWSIEQTNLNSQNVVYTFSSDGNNPVSLVVITNSGCTDTITKNVVVHPLPIANFDYNPKEIDFFDTRICFDNLSVNGAIYQWDFDFQGGQSNQQSPCIDFPKLTEGTYNVQLWVSSIFGCLDSIDQIIIIEEGLTVYVPNAFTPDSDGKNDVFQPLYKGVSEAELFIFNRWGELIFTSQQLDASWDGTYKGSIAKEDTYVWRIVLRDLFRSKHIYTGHLNLLR